MGALGNGQGGTGGKTRAREHTLRCRHWVGGRKGSGRQRTPARTRKEVPRAVARRGWERVAHGIWVQGNGETRKAAVGGSNAFDPAEDGDFPREGEGEDETEDRARTGQGQGLSGQHAFEEPPMEEVLAGVLAEGSLRATVGFQVFAGSYRSPYPFHIGPTK